MNVKLFLCRGVLLIIVVTVSKITMTKTFFTPPKKECTGTAWIAVMNQKEGIHPKNVLVCAPISFSISNLKKFVWQKLVITGTIILHIKIILCPTKGKLLMDQYPQFSPTGGTRIL